MSEGFEGEFAQFEQRLNAKIDEFLASQKNAIIPGAYHIIVEDRPATYRNATEQKGSPIHRLNPFRNRAKKEGFRAVIEVSYLVNKETKKPFMRIDVQVTKGK